MSNHNYTLKITGMHCASCVNAVEHYLSQIPGVVSVSVNLLLEKARVESNQEIPMETFVNAVASSGYTMDTTCVHDHMQHAEHDHHVVTNRTGIIVAWIGFLFIMGVMVPAWMGNPLPFSAFVKDIILLSISSIITFYSGRKIISSAIKGVRHGSLNMDTLTTLGVSAALLSGVLNVLHGLQFFYLPLENFSGIAGMIITLAVTGHGLEAWLRHRSVGAIKTLLELAPNNATVLRDNTEVIVSAEQLLVDDIILIKPGEKVPTDGVVIEGASTVDESMVTGESLPVEKDIGSELIGATINGQGRLVIQATKVGRDTFFQKIVRIIEEAQTTKPQIQLIADKITSVFVPIVLIIACTTFGLWMLIPNGMQSFTGALISIVQSTWFASLVPSASVLEGARALSAAISASIAVLVIACPCALGLAVPAAISVGVAKGSQFGVLFKNAEVIERLRTINTIAMDKTGTITAGSPHVTYIHAFDNDTVSLIKDVAILEQSSEHPLAKAMVSYYKQQNPNDTLPQPYHMEAVSGRGIKGKVTISSPELLIGTETFLSSYNLTPPESMQQAIRTEQNKGATISLVATKDTIHGFIACSDVIRNDSNNAIEMLQKMNLHTTMITGDNRFAAQHIAQQVHIQEVIAETHPDEKYNTVIHLQNKQQKVLMVGDGINDAPALTQADVGVAIGDGTDVAIESGDVVLIKGNLTSLVDALRLSRRIYIIIVQNLFWASIYNLVMIPLAIAGIIHPVLAEMAMGLSSITILLNTNRLWLFPRKKY